MSSSNPELSVHFDTDKEGNPLFVSDGEKKHYRIIFEIENAPPDVYEATFELDPTYYDPLRTIRPDSGGRICLSTTSYGDYGLKVTLHTKKGERQIVERLTQALERTRPAMPSNTSVDEAISEISKR